MMMMAFIHNITLWYSLSFCCSRRLSSILSGTPMRFSLSLVEMDNFRREADTCGAICSDGSRVCFAELGGRTETIYGPRIFAQISDYNCDAITIQYFPSI